MLAWVEYIQELALLGLLALINQPAIDVKIEARFAHSCFIACRPVSSSWAMWNKLMAVLAGAGTALATEDVNQSSASTITFEQRV